MNKLIMFLLLIAVATAASNVTKICDGLCCRNVVTQMDVPNELQNTIAKHYEFQADKPMDQQHLWLGAHNTLISYARGYGLCDADVEAAIHMPFRTANQQLNLPTLLDLGVRQPEFDVHWHNGDLRICHAGGVHLKIVDALLRAIGEDILHHAIDWDSETIGCWGGPYEQLFSAAAQTLATWVRAHPTLQTPVLVMLDDDPNLAQWHVAERLAHETRGAFGDLLITPADFNVSTLMKKTPRQLAGGIIVASRSAYVNASETLYPRDALNGWNEFSPHSLTQSDTLCDSSARTYSREITSNIRYGPFYHPATTKGVWNKIAINRAVQCRVAFPSLENISLESATEFFERAVAHA